jgi:hypothetical protein
MISGGKNSRGIRVSSYDPEDPQNQAGNGSGAMSDAAAGILPPTLGSQRKFMPGTQKVSTISSNYNEKSMLLSSDDEYQ